MATKKKTKKKKLTRSKKTAGGKVKLTRRQTKNAPGKPAKKTAAPNKAAARKKSAKGATSGKTASVSKPATRKKSQRRSGSTFLREMPDPRSGEQSGDLQGLSDVELADSESVDELVEEGNALEAGVVMGVEDAEERGEREVRTHEVPEDDVPEEYLDQD
jgi:hypothetical protein